MIQIDLVISVIPLIENSIGILTGDLDQRK